MKTLIKTILLLLVLLIVTGCHSHLPARSGQYLGYATPQEALDGMRRARYSYQMDRIRARQQRLNRLIRKHRKHR